MSALHRNRYLLRLYIINCLIFFAIFVSSCSNRNLVYFSDLKDKEVLTQKITNKEDAKIQVDDLLSITVTSLSPEANSLFNRGAVPTIGGAMSATSGSYSAPSNFNESYLVDKTGYIDFPVLGKLSIAGLTRDQAKNMITDKLLEYLKDPIVYIRFLNFKITVLGEVQRPSSFTIPTERINILEALGMAGDMTPFGLRESVLVMREKDGVRTFARVNLNSKDILNSPFFYLQQNDIIYVVPDKAVAARASNADRTARILQVSTAIASLIIVIITQFLINR